MLKSNSISRPSSAHFFFQVEDSVSVKDILISADKLDHKKANGIIYSLVKEEILQSVSPVRIRTSNSLLK